MTSKLRPPVVEINPSNENVREVILAAERGEPLWFEGNEGIVQPMEDGANAFVRAAQREEDFLWDLIEEEARVLHEAAEDIGVRLDLENWLPKT